MKCWKANLWLCTKCSALDKTISNLEMELAAARATQESIINGSPVSEDLKISESIGKRKYLMVVGINTAFSSRKRRDSVRATWMPHGMWIGYPHFISLFFFLFPIFHWLWSAVTSFLIWKTGDKRKKLEEEKGIVIRFVIGHRWVFFTIVKLVLFFIKFMNFMDFLSRSCNLILSFHYLNHGIDAVSYNLSWQIKKVLGQEMIFFFQVFIRHSHII